MFRLIKVWLIVLLVSSSALGDSTTQQVSLTTIGTNTYYVDGRIEGAGDSLFLVDTGSGYSTISETTLAQLKLSGHAEYVKKLEGVLANGTTMIVPVYRITSVVLAGKCVIQDVEVAVFPKGTRQILGLSVLSKLMPVTFALDPPSLTLSNCMGHSVDAKAVHNRIDSPASQWAAVESPAL